MCSILHAVVYLRKACWVWVVRLRLYVVVIVVVAVVWWRRPHWRFWNLKHKAKRSSLLVHTKPDETCLRRHRTRCMSHALLGSAGGVLPRVVWVITHAEDASRTLRKWWLICTRAAYTHTQIIPEIHRYVSFYTVICVTESSANGQHSIKQSSFFVR